MLKISVLTQKCINNKGLKFMTEAMRKNMKQKTSCTIYQGGVRQQISNIYAYSPWVDVPEKPGWKTLK
jgi:hypothetical protein